MVGEHQQMPLRAQPHQRPAQERPRRGHEPLGPVGRQQLLSAYVSRPRPADPTDPARATAPRPTRNHLHRPPKPLVADRGPQVRVPVQQRLLRPLAAARHRARPRTPGRSARCRRPARVSSYSAWNSSPSCNGDSGRMSSSPGHDASSRSTCSCDSATSGKSDGVCPPASGLFRMAGQRLKRTPPSLGQRPHVAFIEHRRSPRPGRRQGRALPARPRSGR